MNELNVGDVLTCPIDRETLSIARPCDKDSCLLSIAECKLLDRLFGAGSYNVVTALRTKTSFEVGEWRYTGEFDDETIARIRKFDNTFLKGASEFDARASVGGEWVAKITIVSKVRKIRLDSDQKRARQQAREDNLKAGYIPKQRTPQPKFDPRKVLEVA